MLQKTINDDRRVATLIDALSGTLKNIDTEFQFELARAKSASRPDLRPIVVDAVRRHYLQRREPYVRHIAELRSRMNAGEARI
jgi:hypothetical protein